MDLEKDSWLCRAGHYEPDQKERAAAEALFARAESLLHELRGGAVSDVGGAVERLRRALRDEADASEPHDACQQAQ